ncbi:MAG TPA: hypothetical protein VFV93_14795 [Thermomicrobiales bacterium]|nr:hypothetical protein [Thermomicrobiales bacterium]
MFDSTALLGLFRPFRYLAGDGRALSFWSARTLELLADWVLLVALFVAVYAVTADIAVVALFMLLRVLPRAVISLGFHKPATGISPDWWFLLGLSRVPLIASLALLDSRADLVWAGVVGVMYGLLTALSNESRAATLPRIVPRTRLALATHLNASIERITFVAGPLLAATILRGWDIEVALLASAGLVLVASVLLWLQPPVAIDPAMQPASSLHNDESVLIVARHQPGLLLLASGLFIGSALAICLKVVLIELAAEPLNRSDETLGLLLALVGAGTLLGPLSVPRLLGHLPVSLIVTLSAIGIAAGIILMSIVTRIEIVVLVLLGIGFISITNDLVTATAIRRIAPETDLPGAGRLMLVAVIAGQIVAAIAVALMARFWDSTDVMLAVGVVCALLMGILYLASDGMTLETRRTARS